MYGQYLDAMAVEAADYLEKHHVKEVMEVITASEDLIRTSNTTHAHSGNFIGFGRGNDCQQAFRSIRFYRDMREANSR